MDPTRRLLSSPFQKAISSQDTPLPSPQQHHLDLEPVFPLCPYYSHQNPGFDNRTDLTERLSRKSETVLSELLQLPAHSKVVLSSAPWVGVGVGKGLHFGDICYLVIGSQPHK